MTFQRSRDLPLVPVLHLCALLHLYALFEACLGHAVSETNLKRRGLFSKDCAPH